MHPEQFDAVITDDGHAELVRYNTARIHQGKMCCGRPSLETLEDGIKFWQYNNLNQI